MTQRASCRDLSISAVINSLAPLKRMVYALVAFKPYKKMNSLSPTRVSYTAYASPIFAGSKFSSPSSFAIDKTILPPLALAILLISSLSTLLKAMQPFSTKYFCAKSSIPLVDRMTLAPELIIF